MRSSERRHLDPKSRFVFSFERYKTTWLIREANGAFTFKTLSDFLHNKPVEVFRRASHERNQRTWSSRINLRTYIRMEIRCDQTYHNVGRALLYRYRSSEWHNEINNMVPLTAAPAAGLFALFLKF